MYDMLMSGLWVSQIKEMGRWALYLFKTLDFGISAEAGCASANTEIFQATMRSLESCSLDDHICDNWAYSTMVVALGNIPLPPQPHLISVIRSVSTFFTSPDTQSQAKVDVFMQKPIHLFSTVLTASWVFPTRGEFSMRICGMADSM